METPKKAAGKKLAEEWQLASGSKVKVSRPKRTHSAEAQVRKSLADNFKYMSAAEIDGTVRQGMTLRQRLMRDKQQQLDSPGSVAFGKCYYQALRDLYADQQSQRRVATGAPCAPNSHVAELGGRRVLEQRC